MNPPRIVSCGVDANLVAKISNPDNVIKNKSPDTTTDVVELGCSKYNVKIDYNTVRKHRLL